MAPPHDNQVAVVATCAIMIDVGDNSRIGAWPDCTHATCGKRPERPGCEAHRLTPRQSYGGCHIARNAPLRVTFSCRVGATSMLKSIGNKALEAPPPPRSLRGAKSVAGEAFLEAPLRGYVRDTCKNRP
jgi:hypothetical protein